MDLLRKKPNTIVSMLFVIFLIFCGQSNSFSQDQNNVPEITPVCDRTSQVRDAIVAIVPGIDECKDITSTHLSVISSLNLSNLTITALKEGDFDGLSALTSLSIGNNQLTSLPTTIFSGLSSLTRLDLGSNKLSSLHEDIFSGLTLLNRVYLSYNNLSSLPDDIFSGLSSLQSLALSNNNLSSLPAGLFSGLSSLDWLSLASNSLSELPDGIFSGLSSLRSLSLTENSVNLSITVSLKKVGDSQFKAIAPIGAPFNIVLPLTLLNGSIGDDTTTVTIPTGSVESGLFNVTRTPSTIDPITIEIGTLPTLPSGHFGYRLVEPTSTEENSNILSFVVTIPNDYESTDNNPPVFTEGERTTRNIAENTPTGKNIGDPVLATDVDSYLLTYILGGTDAASFSIESGTGQLKTRSALDYETKNTYAVSVTVSDGNLTDIISVTIKVTDVFENSAPVFAEGATTERSIAENTPAGRNIGGPVVATDPDEEDTLTYILGGTDAAAFSIESGTGQLKTRSALDYETKNTYAVSVTVSDGNLTDIISVTIKVTDVFENSAPVFAEGETTERSIAENTPAGRNIGGPVVATDPDEEDTLTYSLGGTDAAAFSIESGTGQLKTRSALDFETKNTYAVSVTVSDGNLTDIISVAIKVTDVFENSAPVFAEGATTERSIAENTPAGRNIGGPVVATDPDEEDTLTYILGGTDAAAFSIESGTGQLKTRSALDFETKNTYAVSVTVSDGNLTDIISVAIKVTDVFENSAPVFAEGATTERSIAENTPAGRNIGGPVVATDPDEEDTLTYILGGTDAATFSIESATGQLKTRSALDYETKNTYAVSVSVSDGNGGFDIISVAIKVTDVFENNAPVFVEGETTERSIAENTPAGRNIGGPVVATDPDEEDTLTYILGGTDAATFSIESATGQLKTRSALDYETKNTYAVSVSVSDGNGGFDIISVAIKVTDVFENNAPIFVEGATTERSIAENTPAGRNIGGPVVATDPDEEDTLTYILGGTDAATFSIESATGQLKTRSALDYETKNTYAVSVSVSDGNGGFDIISVAIKVTDVFENNAPVFVEGETTERSIAENTPAGRNIGGPVVATDPDEEDTLTYILGGTDAATFSIESATGQLKTRSALDYETKNTYAVSVSVSDGNGGIDIISVAIKVTDVFENNAPVFVEGETTERSIAENTPAGRNIGSPVVATDPDEEDTLTYTLGGVDAVSFSIESATGQLKTRAFLDFEAKNTHLVAVTVSDGNGGTDIISVVINVKDLDETPTLHPPVFVEGDSTERSIAENTPAGRNIGSPVVATDPDEEDTLTYSLGGTDAATFSIESATGQLKTRSALDYETKNAYAVSVTVSDGNLTDIISVAIKVIDVFENNPPVFVEGDSTERSIAENTPAGRNIGSPVVATDPDEEDTLTYSLGGTDAATFSIESATGQLKTRSALDFETKNAYVVFVSVSDGNGGIDIISVAIKVTDVFENNPPVFVEGDSTERSIAENTPAGRNIGSPVVATDPDEEDTLTYSLGGTDAATFSIKSGTGQLKTRSALDYETKNAYVVFVSVSDGNGGFDIISVAIKVTDVFENNAPVFVEGDSTERSIAENTPAGRNIGSPVVATDPDEEDTLTYSLGGTDAATFSIESATGQLKTRSTLDYETKNAYVVFVSVSDGNGGIDIISIAIKVTDVFENNPPVFVEGDSTERSIVENTPAGRNIGGPVVATDPDEEDTLTYSLGGTDAATFSIESATGQLKTRSLLDYETKNAYVVFVSVSDGNGGIDIISVAIKVTDVFENNPPVFVEGETATREIAENTPAGRNIGGPVVATDPDEEDTLTYSLGGTDAATFSIESATGQLKTRSILDFETKNAYAVSVSVSDGNGGIDIISVAIKVTDVFENSPPVFVEGETATREIAENTPAGRNIGGPVVATDPDEEDTLTYILGGTDAATFSIESGTGQLKTRSALDFETKNAYAVSVSVSDGNGGIDIISVAIKVTDVFENSPPVFVEGETATREIAENTPAGRNIGGPVVATDPDEEDTLTYILSGTDAATFSIEGGTGQLKTRSALDFETKNAYVVSVSVSDGNGGIDIISVAIKVTDVFENNPPVFAAGETTTRSILENTPIGRNIGDPVTATDPDEEDTLIYSLGGTDAISFSIENATGQLKTHAVLDYETKNSYTVTVNVSDGSQTVSIVVIIIVIDVDEGNAPVFAGNRTTRSVQENTPSGVNVGSPVAATDADSDTLIYSLDGTDASSFSIVSTSGQLKTLAPLDFETKNSYTVTVTVSDGSRTAAITVDITIIDVDESPPELVKSRVSISEIMYGSERHFTPTQWIELNNAGPDIINLAGWKLTFQNVDSQDLTGPVNGTITFKDDFWGDAPRIWPNEVLMVVGTGNTNSGNLLDDQIYDLVWRTSLSLGFWTTWLSAEGFRIRLYDDDGNLVDEAGNLDGSILRWDLPYGQNRGKIRAGNRTSLIRRYANSMPLDGTQANGWISAVDANLSADQITYYGPSDDISTPGTGIVINDISPQYIVYDINQDGVVDIVDLVIVAGRIGQSGPNAADVNGDGVVNIQDLILVASALGQTPAAPSFQPASFAMLTAADIQGWLTAAQGLNLTDTKVQSGIRFLEQLLVVLTPKKTELLSNFPNPFNPETWIPYRLAEDAFVKLTIYDQRGVVIRKINVGHKTAAVYERKSNAIYWDGRNEVGDRVASGIFFYTLTAGNYTATRKMLILK